MRRLEKVDREAGRRGVDFLTLRRVALLLGLSGVGLEELRAELVRRHQPQYSPPVWVVDRRG